MSNDLVSIKDLAKAPITFGKEVVIVADGAMPFHIDTNEDFKALPATEEQLHARDMLYNIQAAALIGKNEGSLTDDAPNCVLVHRFSPGVYVREFQMTKDSVVVSKRHAREHVVLVLKGTSTVTTEYGTEVISAPAIFISHAGAKRVLYNHTDAVWATVHRTDACSVQEAEAELILNDQEDVERHLEQHLLIGA